MASRAIASGEEALAAEVWAQRVAAAVTLSDVAAQLAGDDPADREAAILGGLLYDADDWLSAVALPNSEFRIPNSRARSPGPLLSWPAA